MQVFDVYSYFVEVKTWQEGKIRRQAAEESL